MPFGTTVFLLTWVGLFLALLHVGWLQSFGARAITLGTLVSTLILGIWLFAHRPTYRFVQRIPIPGMLMLFGLRLAGISFLVGGSFMLLPATYAYPAGFGAVLTAAGSLILASRFDCSKLKYVRIAFFWTLVVLLDQLSTVVNGIRHGLSGNTQMEVFLALPFGVLPLLLVPLLLIICSVLLSRLWTLMKNFRNSATAT